MDFARRNVYGVGMIPINMESDHSAAFDPFDGVDKDEAIRVRIKWWSDHVEKELDSHQSPFVAAEVLLQQMNEYGSNRNIAEDLLLVTVLPVLHRCASGLGVYGDLLEKALHELFPAIMFTRTRALSHGEVLDRRSYVECFARIRQKYNYHIDLSLYLQNRMALEERVMTRVVSKLDRLWLKMCFRAWGTLCEHMRAKKKGFQKLAARGATLGVVPGFVRCWRRYAHETILREKLFKHTALTKEIEDLYLVEQVAKSRHERVLEEFREKTRLLEITTERCTETESRLMALEGILNETELSLHAHWKSWNEVATNIFYDARESQPFVFGNVYSDMESVTQNITDTATLYLNEAQKRSWKINKRTISQVVSRMTPECGKGAERLGPDDIVDMVTRVCSPVTPPLRLVDVVRNDQQQYDLTLKFLSCINDGGHCSLFTRHELPSEEEFSTDTCKELGKEMVSHVAAGIDSLHCCPEANERYLQAVQKCLAAEEIDQVHDYLSRVFCELAATGLPLQRGKIEECVATIVEPRDRQIARALYPSQGIRSLSDMVNYLTKVSQLSSWTITSLVEYIENNYDSDTTEDLFATLCDEGVMNYFHEHAAAISSIFARFKEKRSQVFLSQELMKAFLVDKFSLLGSEVETIFQLSSASGKVSKNEFKKFLLMLTAFVDPSPFLSPVERLAVVVKRCTSEA